MGRRGRGIQEGELWEALQGDEVIRRCDDEAMMVMMRGHVVRWHQHRAT